MVWRDQIWRGISIVQKHIQHIHIPAQTIQSPKMCSACNDLNPAHCLHILIMPYFRCGCYFQLSINSVIKIFERSKCGIEYHLEFRFVRDSKLKLIHVSCQKKPESSFNDAMVYDTKLLWRTMMTRIVVIQWDYFAERRMSLYMMV